MTLHKETLETARLISDVFNNNRYLRFTINVLMALSFIALLSILFYGFKFDGKVRDAFYEDYMVYAIVPFVFSLTLSSLDFLLNYQESFSKDLVRLRDEKVQITQKIETEKKLDIFHTIQLSLNELNQYYTINKGQARSSFRWSIFAIVTGFLTIVFGVWLHYFQNKVELSYLAGASGVILEFIGGAYFFVYKKSLEQVNFFFGQLIKIQDTMLAINIANNITIDDKKVDMHEKIIVSLLERSLK